MTFVQNQKEPTQYRQHQQVYIVKLKSEDKTCKIDSREDEMPHQAIVNFNNYTNQF
jgi:hypothetical protein